MKEFWSEVHRNRDRYWLTNSMPPRVLEMHELAIPNGKVVLDIGIGDGRMSRFLKSYGNYVISIDICEEALEKSDADEKYLSHDISKASPADLAICHLVFQHCSDSQLLQLLQGARIKRDGIFSVQTAYLVKDSQWIQDNCAKGTLYLRERHEMEYYASISGYDCLEVDNVGPYNWHGGKISWDILHLTKQNAH